MAIKTFKRYELKYFVGEGSYGRLRESIERNMFPDENCRDGGNYMIYNLYFDTANHDVIRYSCSKPYFKEKLRLRSYCLPLSGGEPVYLELKKKIGGVVAKRRASMTYEEALAFVKTKIPPQRTNYYDGQVIREISDFLNRYLVTPMVYISYERTAFFGKEDKEFRISFDRNILTRRNQVNLEEGDFGGELIPAKDRLMEVKCQGAMPIWLSHQLSSLGIYKTSFSKYGTEYKKFRVS